MEEPVATFDFFHTWVYVNYDWLSCRTCGARPDVRLAWQGIDRDGGEAAIVLFTKQAVKQLIAAGWEMRAEKLLCPECAGHPTS